MMILHIILIILTSFFVSLKISYMTRIIGSSLPSTNANSFLTQATLLLLGRLHALIFDAPLRSS